MVPIRTLRLSASTSSKRTWPDPDRFTATSAEWLVSRLTELLTDSLSSLHISQLALISSEYIVIIDSYILLTYDSLNER